MFKPSQNNLHKYPPTEYTFPDGTKCAFAFHEFKSSGGLIHATKATFDYKEGAEKVEYAEIWCRQAHPNILFYIIKRHGSHSQEDISPEEHMKYLHAFRLASNFIPKSEVSFMARLTEDKFIVRYFRINSAGPSHQTIKDKLELLNIEVGNKKSCEGFVNSGFRLFQVDITGNEVRLLFTQNPMYVSEMERFDSDLKDKEMLNGLYSTSNPNYKLPEF